MSTKQIGGYFQKLVMLVTTLFAGLIVFAQDKKIDVNISTNKSSNFWGSPWVWVIGAAVFILLLVAILRGGRRDA